MRWAFGLSLVLALYACKEEWTNHDMHVLNPYSDTDETEPSDDAVDAEPDTTTTTTTPAKDASVDGDAGDARADARDATPG